MKIETKFNVGDKVFHDGEEKEIYQINIRANEFERGTISYQFYTNTPKLEPPVLEDFVHGDNKEFIKSQIELKIKEAERVNKEIEELENELQKEDGDE